MASTLGSLSPWVFPADSSLIPWLGAGFDVGFACVFVVCMLAAAAYHLVICGRYNAKVCWSITTASLMMLFVAIGLIYYSSVLLHLFLQASSFLQEPAHDVPWVVLYLLSANFAFLAPVLVIFFCIQIFGRAALEGLRMNGELDSSIRSVIRLNTALLLATFALAWLLDYIGVVVPLVMNLHGSRYRIFGGPFTTVGLLVELILLIEFGVLVCIFRYKSSGWVWTLGGTEGRRPRRHWRNCVTGVLLSVCLLLVRQIYLVTIFMVDYGSTPWLSLLFEGVPILAIFALFAVNHPYHCLTDKVLGLRTESSSLKEPLRLTELEGMRLSSRSSEYKVSAGKPPPVVSQQMPLAA